MDETIIMKCGKKIVFIYQQGKLWIPIDSIAPKKDKHRNFVVTNNASQIINLPKELGGGQYVPMDEFKYLVPDYDNEVKRYLKMIETTNSNRQHKKVAE